MSRIATLLPTETLPLHPFVTWSGRSCLLAIVTMLFLILGQNDPDFEAYRFIYEFGWGLGSEQSRDPGFIWLLSAVRGFSDYEHFRYALIAVFGVVLFRIAPNLGAMGAEGFGFIPALFLAPFVLLKLHVQVREGLALLLWLLAVTSNAGNLARNVRSRRFWILAALSCTIHLSVLMWWAAALVLRSKRPSYRRQAFVIFLLFAAVGATTTGPVSEYIAAKITGGPFFADAQNFVSVTEGKMVYWSLFFVLPLLVLWMFNRSALGVGSIYWQPSIFGLTGTYGLLGFFGASMIGMALWGASEYDFNLTIRVGITLIIFLTIQLGLTRARWLLTWVIFTFTLLVVTRLLFFPQ